MENPHSECSQHPAATPGPASRPLLTLQTSRTLEQVPPPAPSSWALGRTQQDLLSPLVGSCSWSSTDTAPRTAAADPAREKAPGLALQQKQTHPKGLGKGPHFRETLISHQHLDAARALQPPPQSPEPWMMFNPAPWRHGTVTASMGGAVS